MIGRRVFSWLLNLILLPQAKAEMVCGETPQILNVTQPSDCFYNFEMEGPDACPPTGMPSSMPSSTPSSIPSSFPTGIPSHSTVPSISPSSSAGPTNSLSPSTVPSAGPTNSLSPTNTPVDFNIIRKRDRNLQGETVNCSGIAITIEVWTDK